MTFLEQAIARRGLSGLLETRRAGNLAEVQRTLGDWSRGDLLGLGAIADLLRSEEVGRDVRIHEASAVLSSRAVVWVEASSSDLEVLRASAVARIASEPGARIGFDWGRWGLELAQVALGFGVTDLRGPLTRKNGLPIFDEEALKIKGEGMVDLKSLKRRELARLVSHAGREAVFVEDEASHAGHASPVRTLSEVSRA